MTTMGIIFANIYDSSLGELTNKRTMASLPYGGRYRQIDFSLSNMTNSAIRHIGIITKYNYQSLMNHIGSGQEWDLELGEGGLEFLTPFAMGHNGSYRGKLEALDSAMNFLKISTEEYVVLADSGVLCAINLEKIVEAHAASGADVTVVVKDGICNGQKQLDLAVKVDADDRVTDVAVDYCAGEQYLASMGLFVIRRELLMREVTEAAVSYTHLQFLKGVLMMEETKKFEKEREALLSNPKNGYDRISEADLAAMESYCKEYMKFISDCKMEREAVKWTIAVSYTHLARADGGDKGIVRFEQAMINGVAVETEAAQLLHGAQQRRFPAAASAGDAENFHASCSASTTRKAAAFFRRLPTA